jgi:hypothetical protein
MGRASPDPAIHAEISGAGEGAPVADDRPVGYLPPQSTHFFDRHATFIRELPVAPDTATGFVGIIRSRHRYDVIISQNRELFTGARVLDIMGDDGLWSLAALDAGARRVVRVTPRNKPQETQPKGFGAYGFGPDSYEVLGMEALGTLVPGAFDLVLCQQAHEESDPRLFFQELQRLKPKHVILDTGIVRSSGPITRFRLAAQEHGVPEIAGRYATIVASPSHELIMFLCDQFDFQWRRLDWHAMGITKWIGIHDYERDERRTYVLSRISA